MKSLLAIFILAVTTACTTTLNPNGVYHGNKALYVTDASLDASLRVLDVFMVFQMNNRATLPAEINTFADKTRVDAPQWARRIIALRDAYAASPTTESKRALDTSLRVLREAVIQASAYLVEKPANP